MSGIASLQAASAQARQFKIQGIFLDLEQKQEKLKAREQAVFLRQNFLKNIASANASFAAIGVSVGSGIGKQLGVESLKILQEDIQATKLNSQSAQNSLELQKSQVRLAGKTARNLGLLQAGSSFFKSSQSLLTGFKTIKQPTENGSSNTK